MANNLYERNLYNLNDEHDENANQNERLEVEVFSNPIFKVATDQNDNFVIKISRKEFSVCKDLSVSFSYTTGNKTDVKVLQLKKTLVVEKNNQTMSARKAKPKVDENNNQTMPARTPLTALSSNITNNRLSAFNVEFSVEDEYVTFDDLFDCKPLSGSSGKKRKLKEDDQDLICLNSSASDQSSSEDDSSHRLSKVNLIRVLYCRIPSSNKADCY